MSIEIISLLVAVATAVIGIAIRQYFQTIKTLFVRLDAVNVKIDMVRDTLYQSYHDKDEIKEYIELLQRPVIQNMAHIDKALTDLKIMLSSYIEKND